MKLKHSEAYLEKVRSEFNDEKLKAIINYFQLTKLQPIIWKFNKILIFSIA